MECIICQDTTSEPLQDNTLCDCKYKIHASCWIDYVHSKTTVTCLLCRSERVESKKEMLVDIKPTAPPLPTIIEEQMEEQREEQREEQTQQNYNPLNLVETQGSLWQTEGSLWQTEGSFQQIRVITTREMNIKIIKIGVFIVILVFILVLIWS
jgi:hypothetical protein